jgi:hypothetical protein
VRSIFALNRYDNIFYKIHSKNKNSLFDKAKFILGKQRILSLNNKCSNARRGLGKGFSDESFSVGMSRGYSTFGPIKRKDSSNLHEFGPFFKDTDLCMFLGNSSIRYWKGRTIIFPLSITNSIAWYLDIIPDLVKKEMKNINDRFSVLPSYVASFITLSNFSKYREGYCGYIDPKLLNVDDQIYRLKLPVNLEVPDKNEVFNAKLVGDTHPGGVTRYTAYLKNKLLVKNANKIKKIDLVFKCVNDVLRNWNNIGEGKYSETFGTYIIGSREKIQDIQIGEFVKLRTVFIPEMTDILIGSTWYEYIKSFWGKNLLFKSEIWLGHSDVGMGFYRRNELDIKFKYSYEFDGKEWETGVVSPVIVHSFNIIRSSFIESKFIDNHFKFIMDTMVNKKIILHNGNTFLCNNGIPSGHPWTSLINSISNWLIWTSTIKFCPHIPEEFKKDYELQIHGDDVTIHSNFLLNEMTINNMVEWMLINFNYRGKYIIGEHDKRKDKSGLNTASFLKRVVNFKGMLDTPVFHVWEKILLGPEYSGCRNSRMTYLYRRMNDLSVFNEENKERLAYYFSFIFHYPRMGHKKEKTFFRLLFTMTNGFTDSIRNRWEAFLKISGVKPWELNAKKKYFSRYFDLLYARNYLTYSDNKVYVDYWRERKKSVTVEQVLANYDKIPLDFSKDLFKILHNKNT